MAGPIRIRARGRRRWAIAACAIALICLLVACGLFRDPSARREHRYVRKNGTVVTCLEPPPDVGRRANTHVLACEARTDSLRSPPLNVVRAATHGSGMAPAPVQSPAGWPSNIYPPSSGSSETGFRRVLMAIGADPAAGDGGRAGS